MHIIIVIIALLNAKWFFYILTFSYKDILFSYLAVIHMYAHYHPNMDSKWWH